MNEFWMILMAWIGAFIVMPVEMLLLGLPMSVIYFLWRTRHYGDDPEESDD